MMKLSTLVLTLLPLSSIALPAPDLSEPINAAPSPLPFTCYNADHHFKHQHWWISASYKTGCMSLELREEAIFELNKLAMNRPADYTKGSTLGCSLIAGCCEWIQNPLQAVSGPTNGTA